MTQLLSKVSSSSVMQEENSGADNQWEQEGESVRHSKWRGLDFLWWPCFETTALPTAWKNEIYRVILCRGYLGGDVGLFAPERDASVRLAALFCYAGFVLFRGWVWTEALVRAWSLVPFADLTLLSVLSSCRTAGITAFSAACCSGHFLTKCSLHLQPQSCFPLLLYCFCVLLGPISQPIPFPVLL